MVLMDKLPKNCTECPCLHYGEYGAIEKSWCNLNENVNVSENRRPKNCPVKLSKRGRWLISEDEIFVFECSECGSQVRSYKTPYCAECGAMMEDETD